MQNLANMLNNNIDIFCIAETKLDSSFPDSQFFIAGYRSPYRLDVSNFSGGLLVYVNENIPSQALNKFKLPYDIQAIPIEINIRKAKWLIIATYRPDRTNKGFFTDCMKNMLDYYSVSYDNILLMGDMNMLPSDSDLIELMTSHDLYNMIKTPTCFKTSAGRCIDLLLTNKKFSFFNTRTFETGFSDFHVMIYTMLKTTYQKVPPKIIIYRKL